MEPGVVMREVDDAGLIAMRKADRNSTGKDAVLCSFGRRDPKIDYRIIGPTR